MKFTKVLLATLTMSTLLSSTAFAGSWQRGDEANQLKWWYANDDGSYFKNSWQWIDGNGDGIAECYYFDENGWLLSNTKTPDGSDVNENGAWLSNGTVGIQKISSEVKDNQVLENANIAGTYYYIGWVDNASGKYTPTEAYQDGGDNHYIVTVIDDNTIKAHVDDTEWTGDVILKKSNNLYIYESGVLDQESQGWAEDDALRQSVQELKFEGDTIYARGSFNGKLLANTSVFKK